MTLRGRIATAGDYQYKPYYINWQSLAKIPEREISSCGHAIITEKPISVMGQGRGCSQSLYQLLKTREGGRGDGLGVGFWCIGDHKANWPHASANRV